MIDAEPLLLSTDRIGMRIMIIGHGDDDDSE